jgi:CIC family chloride channel protein
MSGWRIVCGFTLTPVVSDDVEIKLDRVLKSLLSHLRSIFDTEATGRLILYAPLVGVVAGLGAAGFYWLLELMQDYALGHVEGYFPPPAGDELTAHAMQLPTHWWAVLLVPALGGLVCGLLVYGFAPEAEGHGTDAMVRAFHRLGGRIRNRVPVIKSIASIITIGTGGSAGREGPIAQIGAGFGAFLSTKIGLGESERRLLMLSGGAGGIGAIFRAPLGGALFVSEVLYGSTALEFAAVVPCFVASITAYAVFAALFGQGLAFRVAPDLAFDNFGELPFYLVFAVVCSTVGFLYVNIFYGLRNRFFRRLPIPNAFKPAVGGLMLGVLALWLPQLMCGGYGWIQMAIDSDSSMTITMLAILCFGKIVATSLTISSGGSGGVFAPSLFIGAMLGGAFGQLCYRFFPDTIVHPEAFVLVGMGGFFAGVARVPLTAMLMVCEMSGSYGLLVPLMLVSIINTAILSSRWTLYEEQVPSLVDSPAHQGDFVVDVLERIHVREVMDPHRAFDLVPEGTPLPEILRLAARSKNGYFPVVDDQNRLTGIFSLRDLRSILTGNGAGSLILATDLAAQPVLTVTPDDDLHTALRVFTRKNIDDIPVVDAQDRDHVLGMISRRNVISAYHERITQLRNPENGE